MVRDLLVTVCSAAVLSGCALTQPNVPSFDQLLQAQTQQTGRICIQKKDIRGVGVLSINTIAVDTSGSNDYHLFTTVYDCPSLKSFPSIDFSGRVTQICAGIRDEIITREEACPIKNIYRFDSRAEAFAAFEQAQETREQMKQDAENKGSSSSDKDPSTIAMIRN